MSPPIELPQKPPLPQASKKPIFVLEYDPATQGVTPKLDGEFPLPALVNALSVWLHIYISQQIAIGMQLAQQQAQQGIVGLDGRPLPRV